jgi:hypothetical protein
VRKETKSNDWEVPQLAGVSDLTLWGTSDVTLDLMDGDSTANTAGIAVQLKFAHGTTTGLPTKATGT